MKATFAFGAIFNFIVIIAAFYTGIWHERVQSKNQWLEYKIQLQQKNTELTNRLAAYDEKAAKQVDRIKRSYQNEIDDLNSKYNAVLSNFNRLHKYSSNSNSTKSMPSNAAAPNGAAKCGNSECSKYCKQLNNTRSRLAKLSNEFLKMAKAKDELAIRYNTLLEFYNKQRQISLDYTANK